MTWKHVYAPSWVKKRGEEKHMDRLLDVGAFFWDGPSGPKKLVVPRGGAAWRAAPKRSR